MRLPHRHLLTATALWLSLGTPLLAEPAAPAPPQADASFAGAPGKREFPNAAAIVLKDDIRATVHADGTQDLVEYDAIKLLDKDGIERFGQTARLYDAKVESVEVPLARIWSPDGQVTSVPASAIVDSVPEDLQRTALYGRVHMLSITFKDAVEGSVVEYKIVHHRRVPRQGRRFWEVSYTQDFQPMLDTALTFDSPERLPVEIATPGTPNLQPVQVQRGGGRTSIRWRLENRPALDQEPAMPALRQVASQIQISSFSGWEDFGAWAKSLWDTIVSPDAAIQAKTATIVSGLVGDEARIAAIMRWIDKEKRPLKTELSFEDVEPVPAAQALTAADLAAHDRASLLIAMLRAANIRVYPALVATSDYGDPTRGLPSPLQFNRLLAAVVTPRGFWWIDPMAATPGVLGPGLNDRLALVLNGSGRLTPTSLTPPHANREEISGVARLDTDGSMETRLSLSEHGANSALWRAMLGSTSTKEQQQVFQLIVGNINPTAVLRDFYVPQSTEGPMQMTLSFEESRAGSRTPDGDGFQFAIPLLPQRRLIGYAKLAADRRRYPIVLGATTYEERRLRIVIPSGWTVRSLPRSVSCSNEVGSYQVDVRADERTIHYYSRLIIRRSEIPVAEYGKFKALMDQMAATTTERVVVRAPSAKPAER